MDDLNEKAKDSFARLKTKMKLDLQGKKINEAKVLLNEEFEQLQKTQKRVDTIPTLEKIDEITEANHFVDSAFDYIEKLKLPPKLSLAIGLIVSGNKTNNPEDYNNARIAIKEHLMAIGYGMREN